MEAKGAEPLMNVPVLRTQPTADEKSALREYFGVTEIPQDDPDRPGWKRVAKLSAVATVAFAVLSSDHVNPILYKLPKVESPNHVMLVKIVLFFIAMVVALRYL